VNGGQTMRIEIDTDRCIGAAQCVLAAPGVFTQDEEGISELVPGGADSADEELLSDAAHVCPVQAIRVTAG
jgi:ferredoxin